MILVWNNINSFKRHLEDMRLFRQSHNNWQNGTNNRGCEDAQGYTITV